MAFTVTIGADAQPDTGFGIVIGTSGGSMLDFTIPTATSGSVLLVAIVRDGAISCSDASWTQVTSGVGSGGLLLDVFTRTVDGTTGSVAGDVISFLSVTTQELVGGLTVFTNAEEASIVYDVQHAAFTADTSPDTPSATAAQDFDSLLCIWVADTILTLTPPVDFDEIDSYSDSGTVDRTLLIAHRTTGDTGSIFPASAAASGSATGRAFTLAVSHLVEPPGSTLTAMQAGNVSSLYVAAIEGYANLLTDGGDTDETVVAWSGSGYTAAIGGLYVRHNPDQQIDPWNPFANTGGRLTLQVVTDSFGVDTHIKSGGADTFASASVDCDDTTLTVKSTASFGSTGAVYLSTEAMTYTGKTGTTFTGLTRGKYSPFLTEAAANLAHPHTITTAIQPSIALLPVASSTPRSWIGKWVGLWRHLYDASSGLLNVKSDALCVFPGRIIEVKDNPATMTTDVECQHVLEYMRDAVLGENPWKATIEEGITLDVGMVFDARDFIVAAGVWTLKTATQLVVVASSPSGSYQVLAGRYQLTEIIGILNKWLEAALTDADLTGTYSFRLTAGADGVTHTKFTYDSTGDTNSVEVSMPPGVLRALGGFAGSVTLASGQAAIRQQWVGTNFQFAVSTGSALRAVIASSLNDLGVGITITLESVFGEFFDQAASLPDSLLGLLPDGASGGEIGICMFNDTQPVIVSLSGGALIGFEGFDPATGAKVPGAGDILYDDPAPLSLRQIYVLRDTFANILLRILLSTGTTGHNHATYDTHPAILGLGIPYGMCSNLVSSVLALGHADQEITLVIDRPKKLIDLIGACLKLRHAFPRWNAGSLEFYQWVTPTTGDALVEDNKASPAGNRDEQRSASNLTDRWTRNIIKVDYDRDFKIADTGSVDFHSHVTIIDRAGIDDAGGQKKTETIPDPTSFTNSFLGGSGSLSAVLEDFKSTAQMFTRPVRTSRRTIAPTMFEGLCVGDCVIVTDEFARDPDTGARGVTTRPGIIVSHSYEPGGFTPGSDKPEDMHGEVEVMFLDLLRVGPYVPFANVASVSGADITVNAHDGSDTTEAVDASWMSAGRKVRIVQRDPADPAAPLSWDRIVSSVTGNVVTLTASLSSPAYDAGLNYRMVWDDYSDAIAAQQVYSYQADDADYLIADTRAPYQYTANTGLIDWIAGDADGTVAVELPPDSSYGDGVGFDVGHQQALNRLANNLYDYKTAASAPIMFATAITVLGDTTHDWVTSVVVPIFLGRDQLNSLVRRKLYVAPMFKSTGGSTVSARITLTKFPPTGDSITFTTSSFAIPKASATFTTTSTTYATATASGISFGQLKDIYGVVYLTLELQVPTASGSETVSCLGIATAYEGPRE